MRSSVLIVAALVWLGAAAADAQYYRGYYGGHYGGHYGGWGYPYRASTVYEGYGRGMADVIRSQSEANLYNARAAKEYEAARSAYLDNRQKAAEYYYQQQKYREEMSQERTRRSAQQVAAYLEKNPPPLPAPSQLDPITGTINWPPLLQADKYADDRKQCEAVFARRASLSGTSQGHYQDLLLVTGPWRKEVMQDPDAKERQENIDAVNFIRRLENVAKQPVG